MRIKITAPGIYDGKGKEIQVGTELTVKAEPKGWAGRYTVLTEDQKGKTGVKAVHRGGGSYSIMDGDKELVEKLSKDDAEAFNALSDEDKAAFVAEQAKA